MRVVIVGNGVAGMEAALELRARDAELSLTIVSEESDHFFSRTALMWVCSGQLRRSDIEPLERDAYQRLQIARVRGRAVGLDAERRQLIMREGAPIAYDKLLIACGSRPRPGPWPGSDLLGVGHFVTLQDLEWYQHELSGVADGPAPRAADTRSAYSRRAAAAARRKRPAREVVVIGGGLIGIEAVEIALHFGLRPHFIMREEWFWPIALDARESAFVCERLQQHGAQLHFGDEVQFLADDGTGMLAGVQTAQGTLACDAAVIAIGVVPNTEWLRTSAVQLDAAGGIVVDAALQSAVPDVYAAGDCASVPWSDGRRRPEQLWYTSRDQGRVAARTLNGELAQYHRGTPYNSAKLADLEYTTVGEVGAHAPDTRSWYHEERAAVRSTTRIVLQGDRVIGFNLLGRRWDHSVLARFIEQRRALSWVLDHLHEAAFDTEFVPPLDLRAARRAVPAALSTAGGV